MIVAEAVWQYSYHVLAGLRDQRGPILTVANWAGQWPGLVGLLNLNGCLTKMGVKYSTLWSENFDDPFFLDGIRQVDPNRAYRPSDDHVRDLNLAETAQPQKAPGRKPGKELLARKKPSWAFLMRAAWACTMPSSRMNC